MKLNSFENKLASDQAMASLISRSLRSTIKHYDNAFMLVSGGSTPLSLYKSLAENSEVDWSKVTIGLVDERCVPSDHAKSNEKAIRETLIQNHASKANFLSMFDATISKEENLKRITSAYEVFRNRLDITLLGMGADGHTASLFPNDGPSEDCLARLNGDPILYTNAPVEPTERITCAWYMLKKSRILCLQITGTEKLKVLGNSAENKLPIAKFISNEMNEMEVFYSK